MSGDLNSLSEILKYIDPEGCDYQEWINVGMALKHEGFAVSDWDSWSRADSRYHSGECAKKWESFNGSACPVTAGTIIKMAVDRGYGGKESSKKELDWEDEINYEGCCNASEGIKITEPESWNPVGEIITYLSALFEAEDNVGYVTETYKIEKDGKVKYLPTKGSCDRTAGELIKALNTCGGDIGAVLGDYKPEAGAWVRFNPLDGRGVTNENVTDYRYALVESDSMPLEQQNAVMRELELPIAVMVYSGGKSVHAIVHIDAPTYEEYRRRVDYLYRVCKDNGLEIDKQNRNPSRLSRLPGVIRNGKKQFIIDRNIGKESFDEWKDYIESINDSLPDTECLKNEWDNLPELAPCLINGILRQGHKMLVAGPAKAGKSFALIELCISIAEGKPWLGFECAKGKVLYVNLELDRASCLHRFKDVYSALDFEPANLANIDVWNLRGKSIPMDKLAPKLIRRAAKKSYIAIIIDPIYKVITGDENSADQMAKFCNQFDKVCTELGCAVIYCHHHSKGSQGGKRSMDRASGSGVFARDPDALLDLTQLEIKDSLILQQQDKAICERCAEWIERFNPDIDELCSQDDLVTASKMLEIARENLKDSVFKLLREEISVLKEKTKNRTAWRIEGTLREFPGFKPLNLWFDYPVHKIDMSGVLKDCDLEGDTLPWQRGLNKAKKTGEKKQDGKKTKVINAIAALGGEPTMDELCEYFSEEDRGFSKKQLSRDVIKYGFYEDKNDKKIKLKNDSKD